MADRPDDIGYGKPPKHRQFVKGRSGNPKGRPKGAKNLKTRFQEAANKKIKVTENGVTREITKVDAGLTQFFNKVAAGEMRALNSLPTWFRVFSDPEDEPGLSTPFSSEDDKTMKENILKRFQETYLKKDGNEE
jgi:hypothetical protein